LILLERDRPTEKDEVYFPRWFCLVFAGYLVVLVEREVSSPLMDVLTHPIFVRDWGEETRPRTALQSPVGVYRLPYLAGPKRNREGRRAARGSRSSGAIEVDRAIVYNIVPVPLFFLDKNQLDP
jgi:hypothetical protein